MTQFSVLFIDHQYSGGVDWYYTNFALAQSMVQPVASGVKCQNMTSPKLKAAAAADEKFSYLIKQMDGYKRIQFLSIMIIKKVLMHACLSKVNNYYFMQ